MLPIPQIVYSIDSNRTMAFVVSSPDGSVTNRFELIEDHSTEFMKFIADMEKEKKAYEKKTFKQISEAQPELFAKLQNTGHLVVPIIKECFDLGENIPNIYFQTNLLWAPGDSDWKFDALIIKREGYPDNSLMPEVVSKFGSFVKLIKDEFTV